MKKKGLALLLVFALNFSALSAVEVRAAQWSNPTQIASVAPYFHVGRAASITSDGRTIVFSGWVGENTELFAVNSDGTGLKQLTNNSRMEAYPSISSDGSKIVFLSFTFWDPGSGDPLAVDYQLFVMNSDGIGLTRLTNMETGVPSISSDGSKVAFCSDSNYLYVINSDGTGLKELSNVTIDLSPSISGMGNKIAFVSKVYDDPLVDGYSPNDDYEIFSIDSDGTARTQLTFNFSINYYGTYPSITSDGSKVVFTNGSLYMVSSDGSGLTQLTSSTGIYAYYPSISGDGTKIAFSSELSNEQGTTETFSIVNSDGTGLVTLGTWSYQSTAGGSCINEEGNTIVIPLINGILVSSTTGLPVVTPAPSTSPSPSSEPTPRINPTPSSEPTGTSTPAPFPEPTPETLNSSIILMIASVSILAIVILGLFVYLKKRRKNKNP